jgi:hypothetical protein
MRLSSDRQALGQNHPAGARGEGVSDQFQVWGLEIALYLPRGSKINSERGGRVIMKDAPRITQKLARQAFGILLELRAREDAHTLLNQAIAFLGMLAREKDTSAPPIMLSVRVMQLRKS